MKKLLVIPLLLAVAGCLPASKYASKFEADDACEEWRRIEAGDRNCIEEDETNQILGEQWSNRETKIVKYFRY
tara:strand:- start:89 stop:307 length:219 start_codon:yes stop_codon:yes gene_type:complete